MKLASLNDGSRDGQLVVVSRDLSSACIANGIAGRLQAVLDDWNFLSPQLESLYEALNAGRARHAFAFDPAQCLAPLPRAALFAEGWADGPADPALVRADALLGPHAPAPAAGPQERLGVAVLLAAVTGDVPAGAGADQALDGVRLLLLAGAWRLDGDGVGAWDRRPATAFAPVAVTPDEAGAAWRGGRLHRAVDVQVDRGRLDPPDLGTALPLGPLLAALARRHPLAPGSIVATGVPAGDAAGLTVHDRLRLAAHGDHGADLFGAITTRLRAPAATDEGVPEAADDGNATREA
ncbi:fumarylacetoacetate hydrolase family protein [Aquabacterium sp. J223]|uniref:fumarylacetoacetate hydrolase family protein n=1 Tax=Aquabacterium sp. J223 TaxID=2898431 RepID=UPI0021ADDD42|nr:fumarylacetoacetate hydrolase family protein [Aquabacterium sp. J223]UUX96295.1 fumarylacetoacetate hydrolase family protein [Aquabacterium sp. J223]